MVVPSKADADLLSHGRLSFDCGIKADFVTAA
jgi:hypothetical protein